MSGIIVWLTLAVVLAGPPAQAAAPAPVSKPAVQVEVRRLIEQLGNTDFKLRTAAFARLKAIGLPAYEQLKAASEDNSDAEVAASCEDLLARIEPLAAAERCIREHPRLAVPLRELAKTYPRVVMLLGGTAEQQVAAVREMRNPRFGITAGVSDILHEWATGAKDASVRDEAGRAYVLQGIIKPGMALIAKDAPRRRRLIEFVLAGKDSKGGWSKFLPPVQAILKPPVQGVAMRRLSRFKETAPLFHAAVEKCIQAHPAVAKPLGAIAKTYPDIVIGLGGSADWQRVALESFRQLKPTGAALDILHYWATRAEDSAVRDCAGFVYASRSLVPKTPALLQRNPDRRRRLIEFVFSTTSGWAGHLRENRICAARALLRFDESSPLLARWLVRLRENPEADLATLCQWLVVVGDQPASRHRRLVPVAAAFLDDTRTIKQQQPKRAPALVLQVADHAIGSLHRMTGKKWSAGLTEVALSSGACFFESDTLRQKYIAAFRTWYSGHRAEFAPDPATRPATQPAAQH